MSTQSEALIFGVGAQGRIVLDLLRLRGRVHPIGFLDDDRSKHGSFVAGLPVLGGLEWLSASDRRKGIGAIVAVGDNEVRILVGGKLRGLDVRLINAVHPSATVMSGVSMGTGNLICAGAVLVTGTRLEDDAVVNTAATLDHDCIVKTGAYISPGVHTAGCVTVGRGAFLGLGTIVGPGVTIGDGAIVGAGSLVLSDVPRKVLALGSPAKVIRELNQPVDWRRILAGR